MKKMKFSSQICTTKEQGKRLLELGLKPETADMVWHHSKRTKLLEWELRPHRPTLRTTTHMNISRLNVFNHKNAEGKVMTGEEYFDELYANDIPAWSLHRLMDLMPEYIHFDSFEDTKYYLTLRPYCLLKVSYKQDSGNWLYGSESSNLFDAIIDVIEYLILGKHLAMEG